MADHALLSASGASRWMACPPSARQEELVPDQSSTYAEEGTLAHELVEYKLRRHFKMASPQSLGAKLRKIKKSEYYCTEMEEYADHYKEVVLSEFSEAQARSSDAIIMLEQRLDYSPWVPGGFGTGDTIIVTDGFLEIIDLKYGKGVRVQAQDNPQMRLYALGALNAFECLYDINETRMTIIQPRLTSISSDLLQTDQLLDWAEKKVRPKAELADKGEGEFKAGDHCRFCKVRYNCRTRARANLAMARYEFREAPVLGPEEIGLILAQATELQSWIGDLQKWALDQAENHGVAFPGWKLVEGRSNRKYADEEAVADRLQKDTLSHDEIYTQKLIGITALEKMIGKKRFKELLEGLILKPPGKPTLVPETDKRPAISSAQNAIADFKEETKCQ